MIIDIDIPEDEPKLAAFLILGSIENKSNQSTFWPTKTYSVLNPAINNQVELLNNFSMLVYDEDGNLQDSLILDPFGTTLYPIYYRALRNQLIPGKQYNMIAKSPDLPTATASFVMPKPVFEINGIVKLSSKINPDSTKKYATLQINFKDPELGKPNYFIVTTFSVDSENRYMDNFAVTQDFDPQFSNPFAVFYNEPFSDQIAQNGEINILVNIIISENLLFEGAKDRIGVTLLSITTDEYLFAKTSANAFNNELNPFAESVNVHSNIDGGYGLFSGRSDKSRIIYIE